MRKLMTLALLSSALLVLGACDSNDDNGSAMAPGGNTDGGTVDGAPMSGDVLDIAGRAADSDAVVLDTDALTSQLDALVGDGDSREPLTIEDGDTAVDVLSRRAALTN